MLQTSPRPPCDPGPRAGFTLAETLIALAAAVVITAAAASALTTALRSERAQFTLLRDSFLAQGWLSGNASGVPNPDRPQVTERAESERKLPWEWALYRPAPGRGAVQAITRVPKDGAPPR